MKKLHRILTVAFLVTALAAVGVFAASCEKTYTLSFESGFDLSVPSVKIAQGESYELQPLQRSGYWFEGWCLDPASDEEPFVGTVTPTADTTYYAKWSSAYLLTLDTAGGKLAQNALWLKEGMSVAEAVEDLVPQMDGVTFGGWFVENEPLDGNAQMPAEALTLTAKYKVGYTVELYGMKVDGSEYEIVETREESGFVGTSLTLSPPDDLTYFEYEANDGEVNTQVLLLPASENIFRFWYHRTYAYNVIYEANAPDGAEVSGTMESVRVLYGASASAEECAYSIPAHRFAGWSLTQNGKVDYLPGADIALSGSVILYAVWDKGYTDRMGGSDVIYPLSEEEGVAVLDRMGGERRGVWDASAHTATFTVGEDETLTALITADSFVWVRDLIAGTYSRMSPYYTEGDPVDDETTLIIRNDFTATFSGTDGSEDGLISADGENIYRFESNTYDFKFRLSVQDGTQVFVVYGKEANRYMQFIPIGVSGRGMIGDYDFELDGLGHITRIDANTGEEESGYYDIEYALGSNDLIEYVISATIGSERLSMHTTRLSASSGEALEAVVLSDGCEGEYRNDDETALDLDGFGNLTSHSGDYYDGSEHHRGYYEVVDSVVFGSVVKLYENPSYTGEDIVYDELRLFILNADGSFVPFEGENFIEYFRIHLVSDEATGSASASLSPYLIVLLYDDSTASIYTMSASSGNVSELGSGVWSKEEGAEIALYTVSGLELVPNALLSCHSFTFVTGTVFLTSGATQEVLYLLKHDDTPDYVLYTEKDGEGEIWALDLGISGMGSLWFHDGHIYEGSIGTPASFYDENAISFTTATSGYSETYYFLLEETDGGTVYTPMDFPSRTLIRCPENGPFGLFGDGPFGGGAVYSLILDGMGGAVYTTSGNPTAQSNVSGTYEQIGMTTVGDPLWKFTPDEENGTIGEFEFVMETYTDNSYAQYGIVTLYYLYHMADAKTESYSLRSPEYGELTLDGFAYRASYVTPEGEGFTGRYYYPANPAMQPEGATATIYLYDDDAQVVEYVVDLTADGSFTVRDELFSTNSYALVDDAGRNVMFDGSALYAQFDGYGTVLLKARNREVARGSYVFSRDYTSIRLDVEFKDGQAAIYDIILRVAISSNGQSYSIVCVVQNDAIKGTYLADDWTALYLDGFGNATYLDKYGVVSEGSYVLLGTNEGAFIRSGGTGFRFLYDFDNASFERKSGMIAEERIYYAADMSPVLFNSLYAVYNGETYFYEVEGDRLVQLTNAATGTVADFSIPFPSDDTYTVNGVTYYLYTPSSSITFHNNDEELQNGAIALDLTFTPEGATYECPAVFAGESGSFFISTYYGEEGSEYEGRFLAFLVYYVSSEIYYEYPIELHWNPNGVSTFGFVDTVEEEVTTYVDAESSGSTISTVATGIGDIIFWGKVIGDLQYEGLVDSKGDPITYFETDINNMYAIMNAGEDMGLELYVFETLFEAADGFTYAIRFCPMGFDAGEMSEYDYILWGVYLYTMHDNVSVNDGALTMRAEVYQFVYGSLDGEGHQWGDLCDAALYLDVSDEGQPPQYGYLPVTTLFIMECENRLFYTVRASASIEWCFDITASFEEDSVAVSSVTIEFNYFSVVDAETDENGRTYSVYMSLNADGFHNLILLMYTDGDPSSGEGWKALTPTSVVHNEDGSFDVTIAADEAAGLPAGTFHLSFELTEDPLSGGMMYVLVCTFKAAE